MPPASSDAAQRSGDEPGDDADDAAGRRRAERRPEHAPRRMPPRTSRPNRTNGLSGVDVSRASPAPANVPARGAGNCSPSMTPIIRSIAGANAAGEIAGLEFRRDDFVDDAPRGGVGERAFEAVADLDAQMAVVLGDDEQRAVVDLLAPDLPGFGDADRELLDGLLARRRHDQHRDLAALARSRNPSASASARRCRR